MTEILFHPSVVSIRTRTSFQLKANRLTKKINICSVYSTPHRAFLYFWTIPHPSLASDWWKVRLMEPGRQIMSLNISIEQFKTVCKLKPLSKFFKCQFTHGWKWLYWQTALSYPSSIIRQNLYRSLRKILHCFGLYWFKRTG